MTKLFKISIIKKLIIDNNKVVSNNNKSNKLFQYWI